MNGVEQRSRALTGSLQVSANPLHVGGNPIWGEYFAGLIDEVRVYNRALSAAEVGSDMNTPVSVPSGADTTPPTVSLTSPAAGGAVSGTVTVSAGAGNNVGVVGVQFKLDGINLGAEDTAAPYSVDWNAAAAPLGAHTLTAVARDDAGNAATSAPIGVTVVDATPPAVAVTGPAMWKTVYGTATLKAVASDDRSVAGVQFLLNGLPVGAEDTAAPFTMPWNTTASVNGVSFLTARARDGSGNTTVSAAIEVTIENPLDTAAPTVTLTSPAAGASIFGNVNLTATATDNVGVAGVQFKLNGANYGAEDTAAPYAILWDTATSANGGYQLTAVARDSAGNVTISAPVPVTVDNPDTTTPVVSLTAPAAGATLTGSSITLSATASDNVGVTGVQFLLDGIALGAEDTVAPYTLTWDSTTVSNGPHTLAARARDAAGNLATSASRAVTVNNTVTAPSVIGQWSPLIDMPIVAIHSVLLKNGKILMWDGGPACIGSTSARVWDPVTGTSTALPIPYFTGGGDDDIFCSAQALLADGRVIVVGGHDCNGPEIGIAMVNFFDPETMTWTRGPDMAYRRWYPTATTLADGRVLVTAGSVFTTVDYVPVPEIYDPVTNTWTTLTSANLTIPNYPFVFQTPDGRVLVAGSDESPMGTHILDVTTQTWSTVDSRQLDAGSAVMYLPGKVMKTGSSYLSPPLDNGGGIPSKAITYVLDMAQGAPAWQQTASMAFPRAHLNLTSLPDGSVVATGGSTDIGGVNNANAVYAAEIWSPATQTWSTMASAQKPRLYHSSAVLLPDGRVLSAGGGHSYFNANAEFNAEIFSPAYLFKGPRPTVSSSPASTVYNQDFFVGTPDAPDIASVSLIRNGSATHGFNMDQRFVPLTFQLTPGGLTVQAPANGNVAPPGTYMLFLVNSQGVPSVASFVRLPAPYEDAVAPSAPTGLSAVGGLGAVSLNWSAASDNIAVTKYNVHRSLSSGFTPSAANRVAQVAGLTYVDTGMPTGSYYYVVTAQDVAANVGPASNEASAVTTSDVTAPTVTLTTPVGGSTLSGVVTLTATASDNVGVAGVQFLLDGAPLGAEVTAAPYSFSLASNGVANGAHTISARARDAAGNLTTSAPASITVANIAPLGLVALYRFDDGAGGTATDSSGLANDGFISGAAWAAGGRHGAALSFDGFNDIVNIADSNSLDLTTAMTLEAWVRPTSVVGYRTVLMKDVPGELSYALYASDDAGVPNAWGRVNITSTGVAGPAALALNVWSHIAATYNGSALTFFVNGTQVATQALSGPLLTSANPFHVGGNPVWGEYFAGLIDEVRVYNRALSSTEIQSDMNDAGPVVQTYAISGTLAPFAAGAGAQVTMAGPAFAVLTADAAGNFSFPGLRNGTYLVTPSKSGYSFSPASQSVTVNGGNVTVNFTATQVPVTPAGDITFISRAATGSESATASMSVTLPNIRAGSFLIITGTCARPSNTLLISDSLGNTFTLAAGRIIHEEQDVSVYVWYVASSVGGTDTFTITPAVTSALEIHVSEWTGIDRTNPIDQISVATGFGSAVSSGTKTTTVDKELIFGYAWVENNASPGAGFTGLSLINGDLDEYRIQTTAGPVEATFTQAASAWVALMMTFRPEPIPVTPQASLTSDESLPQLTRIQPMRRRRLFAPRERTPLS